MDPLLYDTKLTTVGFQQAQALSPRTAALHPPPQLVVASPLRRALHTATLAFGDAHPRLVCASARERLYQASDVGRSPAVLASEHPGWGGFDSLPPVWWHAPSGDALAVEPEPEQLFLSRCEELLDWLAARPESSIALVTHWGVLRALTGREFENCEMVSVDFGQLRVREVAGAY